MRETIAGYLFLAGVGLLGFHAYEWLRHGVWTTYRLTTVLYLIPDEGLRAWLLVPRDWVGVHAALAWLPLWFVCLALGWLVAVWPAESDLRQ